MVLAFDTGSIAGLDLVLAAKRRRKVNLATETQPAAESRAAATLDA